MNPTGPEVYQQAMQSALRLLRGRDLTVAEVNTRLLTKGFTQDLVDGVVASLVRQGYIKDRRVAERAVELARGERPKGRARIETELKARGASQSEIERALVSLTPEAEKVAATSLAQSLREKGETVQRAAARLYRQGYEEDLVASVLESVFGEDSSR